MESKNLLTVTGQYWHFHPLGTGLTYTYHKKAQQIIICNKATGSIAETIDLQDRGGFNEVEEFRRCALGAYENMITNEGFSIEERYFDEKINSGELSIGIDFDLIKN